MGDWVGREAVCLSSHPGLQRSALSNLSNLSHHSNLSKCTIKNENLKAAVKEILKISQKDDVALEGKQTRSVLVLSGNSPFVTSQRDRCIFSYLETDQEAAVCWGSVSVQKQPDDEKNEKQHHDINSTVPTPLFISSAERDTEKTKE